MALRVALIAGLPSARRCRPPRAPAWRILSDDSVPLEPRIDGGALLRPPFGRLTNVILSFMLGHTRITPGVAIEVRNAAVIRAPIERVWGLLADVERWPSWWRACRWVRLQSSRSGEPVAFRWKAHPVELRSVVVKSDPPDCFAITADGSGVHAERTFTLRPTPDGSRTVIVSHETQVGPLPWLGRTVLAPRLHAVNQAMFDDLTRAAAASN